MSCCIRYPRCSHPSRSRRSRSRTCLPPAARYLVAPKILEPRRRQLGVAPWLQAKLQPLPASHEVAAGSARRGMTASLRHGHQFEHHHPADPENRRVHLADCWQPLTLIDAIIDAIGLRSGGWLAAGTGPPVRKSLARANPGWAGLPRRQCVEGVLMIESIMYRDGFLVAALSVLSSCPSPWPRGTADHTRPETRRPRRWRKSWPTRESSRADRHRRDFSRSTSGSSRPRAPASL